MALVLSGNAAGLAGAAPAMAPLPAELESLVPSLAARRLSVPDFAQSRERWADFHRYRKEEVRVRQINREGAWVRVDFDNAREGREAAVEIFQMAWNEEEEGPAPFACNQRLWIWVSPEGSVDGLELGREVHRWRQRADGTVELQVRDEMVDGGTVLVRMIPDRYSGSEVGKTVYWKGEGLCTGAAGEVPTGREIHPDDLAAAEAALGPDGKKMAWISPGMTACEEEIRLLLQEFAARMPGVVAAAPGLSSGQPFKIRLRAEKGVGSAPRKNTGDRAASSGGTGWGRASAPAAAKKASGGTGDGSNVLASLFAKTNAEKAEEKPVAREKASGTASRAGSSSAAATEPREAPAMPDSAAGKPAGLNEPSVAGSPGASGPVEPEVEVARFDERWFDALKEKAIRRRREAFDLLSRSRSPGSGISHEWVAVTYENQPGEPLRAAVATLPLVPIKQLVPESRGEP